MRAGWSTRRKASTSTRSPISTAVIDRNPYTAPPYTARGQSLNALGKYDAAIEDFTAALNVDNRNAEAWAGRGFAYEKLGKKTGGRREPISARSASTATTPRPAPASPGSGGGGGLFRS